MSTSIGKALWQSLFHPSEIVDMLYFKAAGEKKLFPKNNVSECTPQMRRCYELLGLTSRSFAAVIQALHPELRPSICIFYLVLRGLDTVEDDMTIDNKVKIPLLRTFHQKLDEPGWTFDGNADTEKDKVLMVEFNMVIAEFQKLKPAYKAVIQDICNKMGNGMADFAAIHSVGTKEDYCLYCHYVAGLVGHGLSRLFSASELEAPSVGNELDRANSMGLFLQKTNIIRDYKEDLDDGRTWYPKEVWGNYVDSLESLGNPENRDKAKQCLNELIIDALRHIPDVFAYMEALKDQTVFNFCAIPQVMAIATLALMYDNGDVFDGVVKIRKGLAVSLMMEATSMDSVYNIFDRFCMQIESRVKKTDRHYDDACAAIKQVQTLLSQARESGAYTSQPEPIMSNMPLRVALVVGAAATVYSLSQ
mmetsp:Transcript_24896/g.64850  ORF Transcript_24896/g.64850 Transcript_24896/m.64850 type:complete len:419 (+) Transcript_24896:46-1302(+)